MTGPREKAVLQQFHNLSGSEADVLQTHALTSIAVSLAALADLYEMEVLTALDEADEDEARAS